MKSKMDKANARKSLKFLHVSIETSYFIILYK